MAYEMTKMKCREKTKSIPTPQLEFLDFYVISECKCHSS